MQSKNINANSARVSNLLQGTMNKAIQSTVPQQINEAIDSVKIRTGRIIRFYPYIDKALVKLDNKGGNVLCKILHRYGGDIIDFYTPDSYNGGYDKSLGERYVIPMSAQNVCVLNIHDDDSEENLVLGYYQNEEIVGFNPAKPGNIKIMSINEETEFWLKFGIDGFNYRVPDKPSVKVGYYEDEVQELNYSNSDDVYTKEEVDNLLKDYEERIKKLEEFHDIDNNGG